VEAMMNTAPWSLFKKDGSKAELCDETCRILKKGLEL